MPRRSGGDDQEEMDGAPSNAPHQVDTCVAKRIKKRRLEMGMSQDRLGKALALTFQQIQKYENAANRVGASRLWEIANELKVDVNYFFQDLSQGRTGEAHCHADGFSEAQQLLAPPDAEVSLAMSKQALDLSEMFGRITDKRDRLLILQCVRRLIPAQPAN